jgi:hypothetical protein
MYCDTESQLLLVVNRSDAVILSLCVLCRTSAITCLPVPGDSASKRRYFLSILLIHKHPNVGSNFLSRLQNYSLISSLALELVSIGSLQFEKFPQFIRERENPSFIVLSGYRIKKDSTGAEVNLPPLKCPPTPAEARSISPAFSEPIRHPHRACRKCLQYLPGRPPQICFDWKWLCLYAYKPCSTRSDFWNNSANFSGRLSERFTHLPIMDSATENQ